MEPRDPDQLQALQDLEQRARHYGTTLTHLSRLRKTQREHCAICWERISKLSVDHDHATGEVRGLLCSTCNSGLGMFKDSPRLLAAAIIYLDRC